MITFKLAQRSLTLVSMIILARLLVPADFGLVAMATAFVAALELLSEFNFDVALIQHQNPLRTHYNTVWTIHVLFALSIAVLLLIFAVPISVFYQEPRLVNILLALSFGTAISGFENVGVVNFRKELQFNREFLFLFCSRFVGFCVTISLAFILRSYWALIVGMVSIRVTGLIASFVMSPYRPKLGLGAFRELFDYSKWLYFTNMLQFLRHRSSDFIIARFAGPIALGTYSIAYELSNIPTTEMVAPINRAIMPGYVKMAHDLGQLRQGYLDVISLIALIAIPAAAGIAATSDLLVIVLLGEKWVAAAPLISILGLSGAIMAMETNIGSVYMALGKPKILTMLFGFYVAILVPLLTYLTIEFGAIGAAWACLIASVINIPVYYTVMFNTLEMRAPLFLKMVWRPVISAVVMYIMVRNYTHSLAVGLESIASVPYLLSAVMLGLAIYLGCLTLLWLVSGKPTGAETVALNELTKRFNQYFGKSR